MTTKNNFQRRFQLFVVNTSAKILLLNDNFVYVSLHTRAKQELFIVNIHEDIQLHNFVMVKMELLSHRPHTTGTCTNTHASTGSTQQYVCVPSIFDIHHYIHVLYQQLEFTCNPVGLLSLLLGNESPHHTSCPSANKNIVLIRSGVSYNN